MPPSLRTLLTSSKTKPAAFSEQKLNWRKNMEETMSTDASPLGRGASKRFVWTKVAESSVWPWDTRFE